MPLKLAAGVKVSRPSVPRLTVPFVSTAGVVVVMAVPLICVTVSALPSTSVSFVRTSKVVAVSSGVVKLSLTATGASLTAVTVRFTVPVLVPPWPSDTV